jgi:hypothetical protein
MPPASPFASPLAPAAVAPATGGAVAAPGAAAPFAPGAVPYTAVPPSPYNMPPGPSTYLGPPAAGGPLTPFQGNTQPAPAWDPFGLPGSQPATILPQDPYFPSTPALVAPGAWTTMQKFRQEVRLDYVFMPGNSQDELGINDADISATFAIPFFHTNLSPLLITPGFTFHFWNGPDDIPENNFADLPAETYDAYLDAAWNPRLSPFFAAELGARVGVYSDFEAFIDKSLRIQGHAAGIISLSPSVQLKAGAMYLDRVHVQLLPIVGVIWTPNENIRAEILFPNPRLMRRLPRYGNTDWWIYLRGEYGGGSWTVKRTEPFPGQTFVERVDYNDMRAGIGLEFDTPKSWKGLWEVGVAFNRELYYQSQGPAFEPNTTVYVRGSLAF